MWMCRNAHPHSFISVKQFDANKEGSRLGRSIKIARIPVSPFVQIFLKSIEYVLYSTIQLEFQVFVQHKIIVQLYIEIEEIRCMHQLIFGDISIGIIRRYLVGRCKMGHMHTSCIHSRQRKIKTLKRSDSKGKVTVTPGVRGMFLVPATVSSSLQKVNSLYRLRCTVKPT